MKILLFGEYSSVHWTLAQALRRLGHEVCVVSNGDEWKAYPADISLIRKPGRWGAVSYLLRVLHLLPKLRGYDVVQLINPVHFVDLKAERGVRIYDYLRSHNKRVFLGAFGYDYHYVYDSVVRRTLKYCDFYTPTREVHHEWNIANEHDWLYTFKKDVSIYIAETCDGIISGLYEYDMAYRPYFPEKTTFIPMPIETMNDERLTFYSEETKTNRPAPTPYTTNPTQDSKIRFFIGIQRTRSMLKGTDIMLRALERIVVDYPDRVEMVKAESVPFDEYKKMMRSSDVLLDQIYSYTPAMNALQAMSQGLVVVSGGEEENYEILGEEELRPIINVQPDEEDVYRQLEWLVLHPERIPQLKRDSVEYIRRHHDSLKVAERYLEAWNR
ncbi:MAG: glycosyltransferase family 1 protein [Bacteroidaceae bacterium]|nr:glycosyltransferase family 1 protein [Bacteroidaceae bacterium]